MPTRLDLRTTLRRRLEDATASPLWDDATLNAFLSDAMHHYGIRFPAERTTVVAVSDGSTAIPVIPLLDASEVLRVRDAAGRPVARSGRSLLDSGWGSGQGWAWWNGTLRLARPATGGLWEIDHLGRRTLAANDVDPVDIREGDEEIVVLLAASAALLRRAVELGKRGAESAGLTLTRVAGHHSREAERLILARRRRATGGWLEA